MNEQVNINNVTTFASLAAGFIVPIIVKYLNFNIDASIVAGAIVFIIIYLSAHYPNTMKHFNNAVNTVVNSEAQTEEDVFESNDYESVNEEEGC